MLVLGLQQWEMLKYVCMNRESSVYWQTVKCDKVIHLARVTKALVLLTSIHIMNKPFKTCDLEIMRIKCVINVLCFTFAFLFLSVIS